MLPVACLSVEQNLNNVVLDFFLIRSIQLVQDWLYQGMEFCRS